MEHLRGTESRLPGGEVDIAFNLSAGKVVGGLALRPHRFDVGGAYYDFLGRAHFRCWGGRQVWTAAAGFPTAGTGLERNDKSGAGNACRLSDDIIWLVFQPCSLTSQGVHPQMTAQALPRRRQPRGSRRPVVHVCTIAAKPMAQRVNECDRTAAREFKRRIKTQTVLPSAEAAAMLF